MKTSLHVERVLTIGIIVGTGLGLVQTLMVIRDGFTIGLEVVLITVMECTLVPMGKSSS